MADLIDMSNYRANIAYLGVKPWHGMGTEMPSAGATLDEWRKAAGLTWEAREAKVLFQPNPDSNTAEEFDERKVLFRSDTLAPLSVVGAGYKPVQPGQVVHFYEDLCDRHGFAMETMGALKGGKMIWALAKTGVGARLGGIDAVDAYLLLYTSFDQSSATVAKFTSIRVVCHNTLTMAAAEGKGAKVAIRHDSTFDAAKVKVELKVGDAWTEHVHALEAMTAVRVDPQQQVRFLLGVYHNMIPGQPDPTNKADRTLTRLATILTGAPGAKLATARDTVYGLLQAVMYDVDHSKRARTDDGRLASAWMGAGEALKMKAYHAAMQAVGEAA